MTERSEQARKALLDVLASNDAARGLALIARLLELTGPGSEYELLTARTKPVRADGRCEITSMYSGKCARCKAPVRVGDGIWVAEDKPGAICGECAGAIA